MLLHYAEYHEEKLQELYIQYYALCKRGQYNLAYFLLNTEILSNVQLLRYAVWNKHFSTPARILFIQNQSCTNSIYLPMAVRIKLE
jgi:hypothetical protein